MLFLEQLIKAARESVFAYVIHTTQYQLRHFSDIVEQQLTLFLDHSSKKELKNLFEKQPTPIRKFSKYYPSYFGNEAYFYFQPATTFDEFIFSVHLVLSDLYHKYYAVDKAIVHLAKAAELLEICSSSYIGNFIRNLYPHRISTYYKFGYLQMKVELQTVLRIRTALRNRFEKDWKPRYKDDQKYDLSIYKGGLKELQATWHNEEWLFDEAFGKRHVYTDFKSIENAFRLGKVDEKKYVLGKEKNDRQYSSETQLIEAIHRFVKEIGFTKNITEVDLEIKLMNLITVCPPKHFQDRFDLLAAEQKWEYFEMFENGLNVTRYLEYGIIRTNEILLALISKYDQIDLSHIEKEIIYFLNFFLTFETKNFHFIDRRRIAILLENYSLLSEFIWHLKNLTTQDRIIKLRFLKQTDTVSPEQIQEAHSTFEFDIYESDESGIEIVQLNKPELGEELQEKLRICLSSDYIQLAITDIHYLKIFKERITNKEKFLQSIEEDKMKYEKFKETVIAIEFQNTVNNSKDISLEKIVKCFEKYLFCLIEVGNEFHPANMKLLKLNKVIPKFISLLVELENWSKVLYWSDWYFNLPSNFRYSLNKKNEKYLKKQIKHSQKAIDKA